jgi:lipopolysaccharide biosynthesis regulator YciM
VIDIPSLLATPVEGPLSQGDAALLIRYREAIRELAELAEKTDRTHRMEIARLDLALAKERQVRESLDMTREWLARKVAEERGEAREIAMFAARLLRRIVEGADVVANQSEEAL